jgi:NitT/TauT family transport system substrate-binding protein
VSTSLGSTAHGNLVRALGNVGMSPQDVRLLGQDPAVGVTALESGQVAALAQFVPYPQEVVFSGKGRLLNGGDTGVPTFHGVVANNQFMTDHPEVIQAFLAAQWQATQYLYAHPMQAALTVAKATGLPPEVVYLYNGPNGVVTFDMTIKTQLVHAIEVGLPFLKDLGALKQLDLNAFVDEAPLRQLFGADYDKLKTSLTNPAAITGTDQVCHTTVNNPATASEAWPAGQDSTIVAATPTCLLNLAAKGGTYRALYVPDTKSGTRIFGRTATWVSDPKAAADGDLLPFGTVADADAYVAAHPGATVLDYQTALASVH